MQFWRFIGPHTQTGLELHGSYDAVLVAFSITVACLASFAALSVVDRMVAARKASVRRLWLVAGSFAMGSGIWAMHFTAMLAFVLPMPATYDLWITALSVVPAILGSSIALHYMARARISWIHLQLGGLLMAVGIGSMHYIGMEAMRMGDSLHYRLTLFCVSILVAYVLATFALYIKFVLSGTKIVVMRWSKPIAAIVMGNAVAAMHYTAMKAAYFSAGHSHETAGMVFSPLAMGTAICMVTSFILGMAIVGTMVDRRLEEAALSLQKSEAWGRLIVDNSSDGIVSVDDQGRILAFNKAAEKMFGYTADEIIGQSATILLPPATRERGDGHLGRFLQPDAANAVGSYRELTACRKDGTSFPIELGVAEFEADDARFYLGSMRDITVRNQLMSQLSHAQKLESIGQLAAGIAHEINTPIQFIGDNTHFLKDAFGDVIRVLKVYQEMVAAAGGGGIPDPLLAEARTTAEEADPDFLAKDIPAALDQCLDGVERVAKIVQAMKQFSHPGGEEKHAVDLNKAIETTIIVSRSEWRYLAEMETDFDPALPMVSCDLGEFNQVMLNMIVNAAHAIKDALGEGTGTRGRITIRTRQHEEWVEVQVSDTGTGIAPEIRSRVFDPFFTTKEVGKGTGQGLSIAHTVIVKKHGGKISLQSEVGQGTTFTIQLPFAQVLA